VEQTPCPAYHPLNGKGTEEMIDYLTTPTHILPPLFLFVLFLRFIWIIRDWIEGSAARRVRFDADFAEMRSDLTEVKASAQATLATLVDLRIHFDAVAGKLDATADRIDAAVTRMDAPKLRIVPAAE
jgi:hypothetical protein